MPMLAFTIDKPSAKQELFLTAEEKYVAYGGA